MEEKGLTIRELYVIMQKNILILAITIVLAVILGVFYAFVVATPKYESNANVMVQVNPGDSGSSFTGDLSAAKQLIDTVTTFIKTNRVLESAANSINNDPEIILELPISVAKIKNNLSVSSSSSNYFIFVSYQDKDPVLAQKILECIINSTISIADSGDSVLNGTIVENDTATIATKASPNEILILVISFMLGIFGGILLIFLKESLDNTMKSKEDIERLLGLQVIGSVPYYDKNIGGEKNGK